MVPESAPKRIGQYDIKGELGRGGFGRVFRAYDPRVNRPVAIKVLTSEGDKDLLARFRNEAAAAGNLHHPNIVIVYEFGEHRGTPFLAMEFLEGEDLQHLMASRRPLSILDKMRIMSQVADGLQCAHESGVVHRDVKPANVMVQPGGLVKIMDFGIARLTRDQASRLTQQGDLIGTVMYMSPEQFGSNEVDALCDIFSYGAMYYELIAGRHPFQAGDAVGFMHKITSEEPAPMSRFNPECPDGLDAIVLRALSKERELRYQSLRDLQLDARPILLQLQRNKAGELLAQARQQFTRGEIDGADGAVREALDLDPYNTEIQPLREAIQREIKRRAVGPRVEALVHTAEELIARRRFEDAVQSFEAALRLDQSDTQVKTKLERARTLLEQSRKAARLLADAQRELRQKNLTSAFQNASEAREIDPASFEASQLLDIIAKERQRREAERQLQEDITRARGLILLHDFETAIPQLETLAKAHPESAEVTELLERAQRQKEERDRWDRMRAAVDEAKTLLKENRYADAEALLEPLAKEFREEREIADMLQYARQERKMVERSAGVRAAIGRARDLCERSDFEGAIAVLDSALQTWTGAAELEQELHETLTRKAASDRQQNILAVLDRCSRLRAEDRFSEAVEVMAGALLQFGATPALEQMDREIREGWERQKRRERLQRTLQQAQSMLDQDRPSSAIIFLEQAAPEFPEETQIGRLLGVARERLAAQRRAQAIEKALADARRLIEAQDFDGALKLLNETERTFPGDSRIADLTGEAQAQHQAREHRRALQETLRRCDTLAREERYPDALDLLAEAESNYGAEPSIADLRKRIEADWERQRRRADVLRQAEAAQVLLDEGKLKDALALLDRAVKQYPSEARLLDLQRSAKGRIADRDRERDIGEQLHLAAQAEKQRNWQAAVSILEGASQRYPDESAISQGLARARQQLRDEEQRLEVSRQVRVIEEHIAGKSWTEAQRLTQLAQRQYQGERAFEQLMERTIAGRQREADEKRRQISAILERAAELEGRGDSREADRVLASGVRQFPQAEALPQALEQLRERVREGERRAAVQAAVEEIERDLARGQLDAAEQRIESARRKLGADGQFDGLGQRIVLERQRREEARRSAIAAVILRAKSLEAARNFPSAVAAVEEGLRVHGEEPGLRTALEGLRERERQRQEQERRDAIAAVMQRAQSLEAARNFASAVAAVEEGLRVHGEEPELRAALDGLRERERRRQEQERRDAIAAVMQRAQSFEAAQDFSSAETALEGGLRAYGQDAALLEALEGLRTRRRKAEVTVRIESALAAREFESAMELCAAARRDFPGEKLFDQLVKRAKDEQSKEQAQEKARLSLLRQGRAMLAKGALDKAEKACREVLALFPADAEATALLAQIAARREEDHKRAAAEGDRVSAAPRWLKWGLVAAVSVAGAAVGIKIVSNGGAKPAGGSVMVAPSNPPRELPPAPTEKSTEPPIAPPTVPPKTQPSPPQQQNAKKTTAVAQNEGKRGGQTERPPEQTPTTPPPPNPVQPDKPPADKPNAPPFDWTTYGGSNDGVLRCTGIAGQTGRITIRNRTASVGRGTGEGLPGVPVRVTTTTPGVRLLEAPSEQNGWSILVFQTDGTAPTAEFRWKTLQ